MMWQLLLASMCIIIPGIIQPIQGHGYLQTPPGRSVAWKFGHGTPPNWTANELNCGGMGTQVAQGGKCGVCGDPWDSDRPNEAGGMYATGKIVGSYTSGGTIDATVKLTANHKGYFEFRLCAVNDKNVKATQSCLDRNLLRINGGSTRYGISGEKTGLINLKLKIPNGLTCSQCVLQWKYKGGNNSGRTQEQFYNCADIEIK